MKKAPTLAECLKFIDEVSVLSDNDLHIIYSSFLLNYLKNTNSEVCEYVDKNKILYVFSHYTNAYIIEVDKVNNVVLAFSRTSIVQAKGDFIEMIKSY